MTPHDIDNDNDNDNEDELCDIVKKYFILSEMLLCSEYRTTQQHYYLVLGVRTVYNVFQFMSIIM